VAIGLSDREAASLRTISVGANSLPMPARSSVTAPAAQRSDSKALPSGALNVAVPAA
jgi:hypothetical protein